MRKVKTKLANYFLSFHLHFYETYNSRIIKKIVDNYIIIGLDSHILILFFISKIIRHLSQLSIANIRYMYTNRKFSTCVLASVS